MDQVRNDGGFNQGGSYRGGEKRSISRYGFKVPLEWMD